MIFKVVENISVARRSLNIRLFLGIPIFIISSSTQSVATLKTSLATTGYQHPRGRRASREAEASKESERQARSEAERQASKEKRQASKG